VEFKRESGAECAHTHMDDVAGDVCVCTLHAWLLFVCDYYNTIKSVID